MSGAPDKPSEPKPQAGAVSGQLPTRPTAPWPEHPAKFTGEGGTWQRRGQQALQGEKVQRQQVQFGMIQPGDGGLTGGAGESLAGFGRQEP